MKSILKSTIIKNGYLVQREVMQLFRICSLSRVLDILFAKKSKLIRNEDITLKDILFLLEFKREIDK